MLRHYSFLLLASLHCHNGITLHVHHTAHAFTHTYMYGMTWHVPHRSPFNIQCTLFNIFVDKRTAVKYSICSHIVSSIYPYPNRYVEQLLYKKWCSTFFRTYWIRMMVFMQQITDIRSSILNWTSVPCQLHPNFHPHPHHHHHHHHHRRRPFKKLVKSVWIASNFKCRCTACCRLICIRCRNSWHRMDLVGVKSPDQNIEFPWICCDLWLRCIDWMCWGREYKESEKCLGFAMPCHALPNG